MAEIQEILEMLIRKGTERGLLPETKEHPIPEILLRQQEEICEEVYHGVTQFCKGNDQLSMGPMLTIQLGGHAGIGAAARYRKNEAAETGLLAQILDGHDVMELATVAWEQTGTPPGSEHANRIDDHILAQYMNALIAACDGNGGNMDQKRILLAAGAMYRYGILLELEKE